MKTKQVETLLYSAVGVAAMFLLLVGVNLVSSAAKARADLTQENLFTLSAGTRAILGKLDTPVHVRLYVTQPETATPSTVFLGNYARQVEDLLQELAQAANGKLIIEKYNPQPDSDAEDSAKLDGLEGQPLPPYNEPYYLGLAFSRLDEKITIPFLAPSRERLLEYDIVRAISQLEKSEKPVIGVLSALPVFGMPMNPMMMQMGRQGQDPWIFISELQRDFTVRDIPMTVEKIDDDVKVLLVLYPRDITDAAQYAIDQFVLRGGKLIAFVDPLSIADSRNNSQNPLQRATASGASLDKLFKAWGVEFDLAKVVSDLTYKTRIGGRSGPQEAPAVLSLTSQAIDPNDVATANLDNLILAYSGTFAGTPAAGLKQTPLLHSSTNAMLTDKVLAEFGGGADKDFKSADKLFPLAVRLTGKFKTAYPDGKPAAKPAATDPAKPEPQADGSLKESKDDNVVILVGDSDLLFDPVAATVQNLFGQKVVIPNNQNLTLVQGLIEQLAGDSNLIAVRSRSTQNRPFTLIKNKEQEAEAAFRSKIKELEDGLQETQTKLNELQRSKDKGQRFVLSPEQQAELAKFRQKEVEAKRELKTVRKNLRREVDSLQTSWKWGNILIMPLAVALSGLVVALYKRKKTAAK